jgi:hypothetical protein
MSAIPQLNWEKWRTVVKVVVLNDVFVEYDDQNAANAICKQVQRTKPCVLEARLPHPVSFNTDYTSMVIRRTRHFRS